MQTHIKTIVTFKSNILTIINTAIKTLEKITRLYQDCMY